MSKKDKLDIIYEDKELIIINKPAGILTVSTDKEKEKTLFHKVYKYLKQKNKNNKVFIVHRLDRDTSGIVVFSKSEKLKFLLQHNWDNLAVERQYVAVVEGTPSDDEKELKSYLDEDKKTFRVFETKNKNKGKLEITKYKVIDSNTKFSLLKINIKTGKKNQIRVQLSSIGNPIIGDKKYNSKTNPIKRLGLHANKLVLINPITNKKMDFETDVPNEFIKVIKK